MTDLLPNLRRVVTAQRGSQGVIESDSPIPAQPIPGMDGVRAAAIWICDSVPSDDNNLTVDGGKREVAHPSGIVQENGVNCRVTDIAPGAITPMHRTDSIDVNILLAGEIILIMDDDSETHLKTVGDTVVQRGTMHAWKNPGSSWARWASVIVDAKPMVGDETR